MIANFDSGSGGGTYDYSSTNATSSDDEDDEDDSTSTTTYTASYSSGFTSDSSGSSTTSTYDEPVDTTDSTDDSDSDYDYEYDNRYNADPEQAESGSPGAGDPAVDLTAPDANENTDGDGVFVDDDGNTVYDPSQEPSPPDDTTEEIVDRVADDDVVSNEEGQIANPGGATSDADASEESNELPLDLPDGLDAKKAAIALVVLAALVLGA